MWKRFNQSCRNTIFRAEKKAAQQYDNHIVDTKHLLLALLEEKEGFTSQLLAQHGIDFEKLNDEIEPTNWLSPHKIIELEARLLQKMRGNQQNKKMALSVSMKRVLESAVVESRETQLVLQGNDEIGPEHLLLGLLRYTNTPTHTLLRTAGMDLESTRSAVIESMRAR
jgi:ATP-dependent Clp protease ATP-binding subunit ClpC